MDMLLQIRSLASSLDFSIPLFVDTNIVYQLDETKFPGLNEGPPALIVDPTISLNSTTDVSVPLELEEHEDLYNLIESLDVDNSMLLPIESNHNILGLTEIQYDLQTEDLLSIGHCSSDRYPSCRFTQTSGISKRKRHISSALPDNLTEADEINEQVFSKNRKIDMYEFISTNDHTDTCFDSIVQVISSNGTIYPEKEQTFEINFCGSPGRRFCDRQC